MKQEETSRALHFALTAIGLTAVGAAMFALMMITIGRATAAEGASRGYFARLAVVSAALLALCAVVLAWATIRYLRFRLQQRHWREHKPTPYVDAWAEAGRRIKVDEDGEAEREDGKDGTQ